MAADYPRTPQMSPSGQIPYQVLTHPLLKRLSPELRDRVTQQLQVIANRQGTPRHGPSRLPHSTWGGAGDTPPPPNHHHAGTQSTFPVDAAIQTDPPQQATHTPAGVGTSYHSPPPSPFQQTDVSPPPRALHGKGHPVGTYNEATAMASSLLETHPTAKAIRGEAHARLLAERLLAEGNRRHPTLEREYSEAAALGFPSPGDTFSQSYDYTGGEGFENLQQGIRDEFWRCFNAEFDRAVHAARDPDTDSILVDSSRYGSEEFDTGPYGERDLSFRPTTQQDMRSRDETREQMQKLFWEQYSTSLDAMMRPSQSLVDHHATARHPVYTSYPSPTPSFRHPLEPRSAIL